MERVAPWHLLAPPLPEDVRRAGWRGDDVNAKEAFIFVIDRELPPPRVLRLIERTEAAYPCVDVLIIPEGGGATIYDSTLQAEDSGLPKVLDERLFRRRN